jgi:hypothetical protein
MSDEQKPETKRRRPLLTRQEQTLLAFLLALLLVGGIVRKLRVEMHGGGAVPAGKSSY